MERRVVPVGAVVLTTFFALLYALRGSIAAIDRGEDPRWAQQVGWSLAVWWTCLPLLPPLAVLVRRFPVGRPRPWRNAGVLLVGTFAAAWLRHVVMTPVVPNGTPGFNVTPVAVAGPPLVTRMVYVSTAPDSAGTGDTLCTTTRLASPGLKSQ